MGRWQAKRPRRCRVVMHGWEGASLARTPQRDPGQKDLCESGRCLSHQNPLCPMVKVPAWPPRISASTDMMVNTGLSLREMCAGYGDGFCSVATNPWKERLFLLSARAFCTPALRNTWQHIPASLRSFRGLLGSSYWDLIHHLLILSTQFWLGVSPWQGGLLPALSSARMDMERLIIWHVACSRSMSCSLLLRMTPPLLQDILSSPASYPWLHNTFPTGITLGMASAFLLLAAARFCGIKKGEEFREIAGKLWGWNCTQVLGCCCLSHASLGWLVP